jgi:hypothetical protein
MTDALPIGTEARVYLTHRNQSFTATGNVVRSKRNTGIAIKFRVVECSQLPILQEWLFAFTLVQITIRFVKENKAEHLLA